MTTHYELLKIHRSSTQDEVRDAYLRLARKEHPDVGGTSDTFHDAHEAYQMLRNPTTRQQYNAWLDEKYGVCGVCKGRGVHVKQQSFKVRLLRPCAICHGSGVCR